MSEIPSSFLSDGQQAAKLAACWYVLQWSGSDQQVSAPLNPKEVPGDDQKCNQIPQGVNPDHIFVNPLCPTLALIFLLAL
jgi:hypothetical protein